ncbi:MAG: carboxypeptidase regulatory-like domain-containing protein [Gemmatimonadaceae bacterium]|nr:carboxypeptidase regulatory-like domain-containing protein [Gemmatimonadaceae bacterium]
MLMRRLSMTIAALLAAMLLAVPVPRSLEAQSGVLRGVVTDTLGNPIRGVEVFAIQTERSTRTDAQGRYTLTRLPWGQSVVMARSPGYRAEERVIQIGDDNQASMDFQMRRAIQLIDTLRITSHDGCAAFRYDGFECRRRAGIGQFRGPDELRALRPDYWSDMFEGLTGLRKVPFTNQELGRLDWTVAPTTGWRCLVEAYNGRERTAREILIRPDQIHSIEVYDVYERVPEPYKRYAWPSDSRTPCTLIMYWTKVWIEENEKP